MTRIKPLLVQKNSPIVFLLLVCCFLFAACPPPVSNTIEDPKGSTEQEDDEGQQKTAQTPEILTEPEGYTVALDSDADALAVRAVIYDRGTLSYQWHKAESETAEGQAIPGATGRTYAPPFNAEGTFYYYVIITNTNNNARDEKTAALVSGRAKVVVDAGLAGYTLSQFGGEENEADTQSIAFVFSKVIDTLTANNITVMDGSGSVAKETVMGSPNSVNWVLPVTVNMAGTVRVSIIKEGVENAPKLVTVHKSGEATPPEQNGGGKEESEGPSGLAGTAWEWSGVKLTFRESSVTMAGSSKPYPYTFDGTERSGSIETLGDFTVDQDFLRLTFENFNNLGGDPKVFDNLGAALMGSKWAWGQTFIAFESSRAVVNGARYPYAFNSADRIGSIDKIGAFTLNDDGTISIPVWRKSSYGITLAKADAPPAWNGSLIGTSWGWQNAFNGWMVIEFMTEGDCILTHTESTYHDDIPWEFIYTWNSASQSGDIPEGIKTSEGFAGLGSFTIDADHSYMSFIQWREYPHGAVFNRIKQEK
jgi:hypothetical protein